MRKFKDMTLKHRLSLYTAVLLLFSALTVGVPSYLVAKIALQNKGEIQLKNAAYSALDIISVLNDAVENGDVSLNEAQDRAGKMLIGEKQSDGTRTIDTDMDLGVHGYYSVFSLDGHLLFHPTLEGEDVFSAPDQSGKSMPFYFVQDLIEKAQSGGGYTYYDWLYPYSDAVGEKVVYSVYDPNWKWVISVGSYTSDFDRDAFVIMEIAGVSILVSLLLGLLFSARYMESIVSPLTGLERAMKLIESGDYEQVPEIERKDEIGNLVRGYNNMVHTLKKANEDVAARDRRISYYAYNDMLSGLPNRNFLREYITDRVAQESGVSDYHLVLMDIKDFKSVNALYGNTYGDGIIEQIGEIMRLMKREDKIFARVSGNEFAIWMKSSSQEAVFEEIHNLKVQLNEKLSYHGFSQTVDFFTSCCEFSENSRTFDMLYQKASIALQVAKESHYLHTIAYEDDMYYAIERETRMRGLVETAIRKDEFLLYYQNKVNAHTEEVVGVEALARWFPAEIDAIGPSEFIPLIVRAGLMSRFSSYVIQKALDDYPLIVKKFGPHVTLSINISPSIFNSDNFVEFVTANIAQRGIDPSKIYLEITEDFLVSDFDRIAIKIKMLRAEGVRIALDDFGTGYSSLNYLTSVQFDEIKVDKRFIDGILGDFRARALLKSIVDIGRAFDYVIVAEGVETEEQVEVVRRIGCSLIQGYAYSKPEPLESSFRL